MSRIVRLLDPPELTPRQRAQRKYQQSAKGKAAGRRHQRKKREDASFRAAESARVVQAQRGNVQRRVYKRTWQRTKARAVVQCSE